LSARNNQTAEVENLSLLFDFAGVLILRIKHRVPNAGVD